MRRIALALVFAALPGFAAEPERRLVYREAGRFGGWPANYGIWQWDNEILVGFAAAWWKIRTPDHHQQDTDKPEEPRQARSLDGGRTWTVETPAELRPPAQGGLTPTELREAMDFGRPGFAMTLRFLDSNTGPSLLWYTYDRGKSWRGPFRFPQYGNGVAARTDYIVNGPRDAFVFLTEAKANRKEGRPFCMRTLDGGVTWKFVSYIGEEPAGFSIMPSTARLSKTRLFSVVRVQGKPQSHLDAYLSEDNGASWQPRGTVANAGAWNGSAGMLIRLRDGRLCVTYGYRSEPWAILAKISSDEGQTWSNPVTLRAGGAAWDLGYPRSVQRPDGKVVTVYYFNDAPHNERFIEATIWDPAATTWR